MVEIMNIKSNPLQRLALTRQQAAALQVRAGAIVPEAAAAFLNEKATPEALQSFERYCQTSGLQAYQGGAYNYDQPGELHCCGIIVYDAAGVPDAGAPFDLMQINRGDSLVRGGFTIQVNENLVSMKPSNKLPSQMAMMVEEVSVSLIVIRQPTAALAANIAACQAAMREVLTQCVPKLKPQNQDPISLGMLGLSDIGQSLVAPETILQRTSERPSTPLYRELKPPIAWYPEDQLGGESYLGPLTTRADAAGLGLGVYLSLRGPVAKGLQS